MKDESVYKQDEKLIKKFLNDIKKELPTYEKEDKEYLKKLSGPMYDYAETSGDEGITMDGLISRFGTPKECASNYIDSLSPDDIAGRIRKKKHIRIALPVLVFILLIAAVCISIKIYCLWKSTKSQDVTTRTIVIKEYSDPHSDDNTTDEIQTDSESATYKPSTKSTEE